jgi:hypothetical protein
MLLPLTFANGEDGRAAKRWMRALWRTRGHDAGFHDRHDCYATRPLRMGPEAPGRADSLLDGFSNEFRFGMPTEPAADLGDTGASSPECWQWGRVDNP